MSTNTFKWLITPHALPDGLSVGRSWFAVTAMLYLKALNTDITLRADWPNIEPPTGLLRGTKQSCAHFGHMAADYKGRWLKTGLFFPFPKQEQLDYTSSVSPWVLIPVVCLEALGGEILPFLGWGPSLARCFLGSDLEWWPSLFEVTCSRKTFPMSHFQFCLIFQIQGKWPH